MVYSSCCWAGAVRSSKYFQGWAYTLSVQVLQRLVTAYTGSPADDLYDIPVAPVAYRVILEPDIGQFREFEPPRVHTRINSWGLFLWRIDLRKARERDLATLDEKSTSSGIAE